LPTIASALGVKVGFALEVTQRTGWTMHYRMRFAIDCIRSTPLLLQLYFSSSPGWCGGSKTISRFRQSADPSPVAEAVHGR
jgi:hypothetical protein